MRSAARRPGQLLTPLLIGFLALSPLPLGGNRPVFWALSSALIGLMALAYGVAAGRAGRAPRFPLLSPRPEASLFVALCCYAVVQMLPFGAWGFTALGDSPALPRPTTISVAPGMTLLWLLQWLSYGVVFFLARNASADPQRRARILIWTFWIIVAYALYGLLALTQLGDTVLFLTKWTYLGDATGPFVNRNSFATFLAFGTVLGLTQIVENVTEGRGPGASLWAAMGELALFACLLATHSRMGLFASLSGCAAVLLIAMLKSHGSRRILPVLAAGAALAAVYFLYGSGTTDRLGSVESSADVRLGLYSQVWDMITARPLLGWGANTFELAFPLFHHLPVSSDVVWNRAHDTYLQLWSEFGLLFGSIPLLISGLIFIRLLAAQWRAKHLRRSLVAPLGLVVVSAVHSTVDFSLEMQANGVFFCIMLGLGTAALRSSAEPAEAPHHYRAPVSGSIAPGRA